MTSEEAKKIAEILRRRIEAVDRAILDHNAEALQSIALATQVLFMMTNIAAMEIKDESKTES